MGRTVSVTDTELFFCTTKRIPIRYLNNGHDCVPIRLYKKKHHARVGLGLWSADPVLNQTKYLEPRRECWVNSVTPVISSPQSWDHDLSRNQESDIWADPVAQQFSACLQPRAWSWRPGIKSHVGLPAWSLLPPLPVPLPLSLCLAWINK